MKDISAEHQELGRAVTEIIAAYARTLDEGRVCSESSPSEMEKIFNEPLPAEGTTAEEILRRFTRDVVPHSMNIPSPRYFGLFNPTPLPLAVWADALAAAINQNGAVWRNSSSASVVEARVLRWLCDLIGYPEESFGTLTSGGSEANLIALKCARDRAVDGIRDNGIAATTLGATNLIVYASEQCHYSFVKSVDILGLGRGSLRKIPVDERFHIRVDALREEIESDLARGDMPLCVAGAAGATSTGIVDPLDGLAEVARQYNLWFHVDAAYGGALAFSEKHRGRLRGIERADSVTIDPHKWMFVPFACGAVLMRGGARALRDAFDITPEYLSEERGGGDVSFDFFRYGQLGSRRFNALKIWMALKHLGVSGYAEIIERQIELTHYFAARIDESKDFVRVGEVETAVCCFRFLPGGAEDYEKAMVDRLQHALQQRVERSGEAWISTTILHGRRALRVNVNSFLTERRHIDDLVELLSRESARLMEEAGASS
ncbi:MAG TPA: pyridoxal-dependent decarboxylase [Pyrinomonadaceae bacterium]|jgi:aromatic-L-amino-acid decarboxylase|nr:pyridoxal-dependent decarboxylase [Pyrinomonadaceae bacterium]